MVESFVKYFENKHPFGRFGRFVDERELLKEGLITSYPFSSVLSMLSQKYKKEISHIQSDIFNKDSKTAGISLYLKNDYITEELLNNLKKDLIVYGYFIAFTEQFNSQEFGIFIEPKYSFLLDAKQFKNKRCFHITHSKFLNKIEKVGLIPRDSQTHFSFDGSRIYLMLGDDEKFITSFMPTLAKSKNWNPKDLILLEILNFDKLPLYYDMNFNNTENNIAVFTFNNISKDNIKIITRIV